MNESKARFMGGHYDSTKQMSVFRNSLTNFSMNYINAEEAYYTKTKIRLMLDILFNKTVVLTYAQFLDGFFYHRMMRKNDRDHFVEALKSDMSTLGPNIQPMIEIRIWPNESDLKSTMYSWMIRKEGFLFSSLESYKSGLSARFHKFAQEYFKTQDKISLDDHSFKNEVEKSFGTDDENRYIMSWIDDMHIMQEELPKSYTKNWAEGIGVCMQKAKCSFSNQYPETMQYLDSLKLKYPSDPLQELFDTIKSDLDDNDLIPDRSKVFNLLDSSTLENDEKDKIRGMYNNLYNRSMAIQHTCQLCDEGINTKVKLRSDDIVDRLSTRLLIKLGSLDWIRYFEILRSMQRLRENLWLSERDNFKYNAQILVREFLRCINAENSIKILTLQVSKTILNNVASGIVNVIIQFLFDANLMISVAVFKELVQLLIKLGFNGDQATEIAKRLDDACTLVKHATNNLLGGGSNPIYEDVNFVAFNDIQAGTMAEEINPMAVIESESYTNEEGQLNSIYRSNR